VFPATILGTESVSVIPCNGTYSVKSGLLDNLRVVDYRYNRFALDPRTGLFTMVRYVNRLLHPLRCKNFSREWTDSQWTSVNAVQIGIGDATKQQRLTLFNKNEIDIEGKSTVSLLVEEVA
jgi:cation-transporting ATPase 13A2